MPIALPDRENLLAGLPVPDVVAWVRHGAGPSGWGEAARVVLPSGEDGFTAGEKWLRAVFDAVDLDDPVQVRGTGRGEYGAFTFDASSDGSALIVPRTLLGRDGHGLAWLTTVTGSVSGGDDDGSVPERAPGRVRWHDGLPAGAAVGAGGGQALHTCHPGNRWATSAALCCSAMCRVCAASAVTSGRLAMSLRPVVFRIPAVPISVLYSV